MNKKLQYLGKNTVLFTISSFATKIISFLLVPLYTSTLTTAEYGIADLITTTATLLIYTLTLNIADSVTRYTLDIQNNVNKSTIVKGGQIVKKYIGDDKKMEQQAVLSYANRIIILATLVCAMGLGVVCWSGFLKWPLYYYLFTLVYFFTSAFYQMMTNYLRGIDKVAGVAIAGVIAGFVSILCNIIFLLFLKWGIIGYLLAMVIGPAVASVYCVIVAGAPIKTFFINTCSDVMKGEMRQYCIPLIFNNIALWINAFMDRYFVTAMCGVEQNGIYSVAGKIPNILAVCYSIFGQAWNLSAIKDFDENDKDGFWGKTYNVYNALMTFICSAIILFNIPLAKFLYAKDFYEAWRYSSVLLISVMFNALTMFIGSVFSAVKKTKTIAWTTILSAICNTILNGITIPIWGPLGAAFSTAVAYGVMWIVRMHYAKKYIRFKTHLLRDSIVYWILALQVVFEHLSGHFYLGQIACVIAIVLIYHAYLLGTSQKVIHFVMKKFRHIREEV